MKMALREIVIEGDPLLRKKSRVVENIDQRILTLLDDLADTMYLDNRGIGIAAPQVGVLRRVFIVDVGDEHGLIEFINPEMLEQKGAAVGPEGCLSVPGRSGEVERPEEITIRALNRAGESFTLTATGMLAVCICHEYDHLDGILFIDKVKGEITSN